MEFSNTHTDQIVLQNLGERIARYRLNQNLTQQDFADQAGVSRATIQRIEQGQSSQFSNLIRILRALKLLENLEALIPNPAISPIQQINMQGQVRKRASNNSSSEAETQDWTWKD